MASLADIEFDPDDPSVNLWKQLLRLRPGIGSYKPRTPEEKKQAALRTQQYYAENEHPRQGIQPGSE